MFEIRENNQLIKVWLGSEEKLPENCKAQAVRLLSLPNVYKWVCLMPDTHVGKGMPIGGVLATKDIIVPEAVGVDIGCGMNFVSTNIKLEEMKGILTDNGTLIQAIIGRIMRAVPAGREKHAVKQSCNVLERVYSDPEGYRDYPELYAVLEDGYYQIGTLGGGNHFIELQEDEEGYLCIMIHSGSRHIGSAVCEYFDKVAMEENLHEKNSIAINSALPYLHCNSFTGQAYIKWMHLAMEYAFENRKRMMENVKQCVKDVLEKFLSKEVVFSKEINCHHNYAASDHFSVKEIVYNDRKEIKALVVVNSKNVVVFSYDADKKQGLKQKISGRINITQLQALENELNRTGVDVEDVLSRYGLDDLEQMTEDIYLLAMNGLKKTKTKKAA